MEGIEPKSNLVFQKSMLHSPLIQAQYGAYSKHRFNGRDGDWMGNSGGKRGDEWGSLDLYNNTKLPKDIADLIAGYIA
jgi:hypothetical protein